MQRKVGRSLRVSGTLCRHVSVGQDQITITDGHAQEDNPPSDLSELPSPVQYLP